jgi:hypothetical protein
MVDGIGPTLNSQARSGNSNKDSILAPLVPKLKLRHGAYLRSSASETPPTVERDEQRSGASKINCVPKLELGNEGSL